MSWKLEIGTILLENPERKQPLERPRHGWEDKYSFRS
jgi:hypothetical protein